MTDFTLKQASQLFNSADNFPVSFDSAWQWLEYSRKDSAKRNFIGHGFIEGIDYQLHIDEEPLPGGGYSNREDIFMTVNCFKEWSMLTGNAKGKEIRRYFIECEVRYKELTAHHQSRIASTVDTELNRVRFAMSSLLERHCDPDVVDLTIASYFGRRYPELAPAMEEVKALIGQAHPRDDAYISPTQLGKMASETSLGSLSAIAINKLLEAAGLQYKNPVEGAEPTWCLTELGKQYGKVLINARNGNGKTIQNTRWLPSVLDLLASAT